MQERSPSPPPQPRRAGKRLPSRSPPPPRRPDRVYENGKYRRVHIGQAFHDLLYIMSTMLEADEELRPLFAGGRLRDESHVKELSLRPEYVLGDVRDGPGSFKRSVVACLLFSRGESGHAPGDLPNIANGLLALNDDDGEATVEAATGILNGVVAVDQLTALSGNAAAAPEGPAPVARLAVTAGAGGARRYRPLINRKAWRAFHAAEHLNSKMILDYYRGDYYEWVKSRICKDKEVAEAALWQRVHESAGEDPDLKEAVQRTMAGATDERYPVASLYGIPHRLSQVRGDGDCMFHCLLPGLATLGDDRRKLSTSKALRGELVRIMREGGRPENFAPDDEHDAQGTTWEQYLDEMSTEGGRWGDQLVLQAFSQLAPEIGLLILQDDKRYPVECGYYDEVVRELTEKRTILVLYLSNRNHYDNVRFDDDLPVAFPVERTPPALIRRLNALCRLRGGKNPEWTVTHNNPPMRYYPKQKDGLPRPRLPA